MDGGWRFVVPLNIIFYPPFSIHYPPSTLHSNLRLRRDVLLVDAVVLQRVTHLVALTLARYGVRIGVLHLDVVVELKHRQVLQRLFSAMWYK